MTGAQRYHYLLGGLQWYGDALTFGFTTILLFTAKTKTVSVTMFDLRESNDWGPIAVLSLTMLAITFVMVAIINYFTDRRLA